MWPGRLEDRENRGPDGGHGMVRLGDSETVAPGSVTRTLEGENGHPDLSMTFEIREGRPECVELHIKAKRGGRGIRQNDLRGFALDEIAEVVLSRFASHVVQVADDGTWLAQGPLWEEREHWAARGDISAARQSQRDPASPAELRRVAEIYSQNEGNKPVQAVQLLMGYNSRRTAARRAQQARERGLLGKPTGDAGEPSSAPAASIEAAAAKTRERWQELGLSEVSAEHFVALIEQHEAQGRPDMAAALAPLLEQLRQEPTDGQRRKAP